MKFLNGVLAGLAAAAIVVVLARAGAGFAADDDQPAPKAILADAFTYQGRLNINGVPFTGTRDFVFRLLTAQNGTVLATIEQPNVPVTNGIFNATLAFGANAFPGDERWLSVEARPSGTSDPYVLVGQQVLSATPYALHAKNAWDLGGNAGTNPNTNFLGTTDNAALALGIKNAGGLRISQVGGIINMVGGGDNEIDDPNAYAATIAGGNDNRVHSAGSTIGGGSNNNAGTLNLLDTDDRHFATVAGGWYNEATGAESFVGGGFMNDATGDSATVGGGVSNEAIGDYSTVPGGFSNKALGRSSMAAGEYAYVFHDGTFAWADQIGQILASTGPNQFIVRAHGGFILTANRGSTLPVDPGMSYRDNSIVAWGRVTATGGYTSNTSGENFGVVTIDHTASSGIYEITIYADAISAGALIPVATPEVDVAPNGAAAARILNIDQVSPTNFRVYMMNGNYALVDNDFTFIVTAR